MALQNLFGDLTLEETNKAILYFLAQLADRLPRTDALDRQVVALEATGNAVAVSGNLTTVTNVTNAGTLANITAIGGQVAPFLPHNLSMPMHIYNNITAS